MNLLPFVWPHASITAYSPIRDGAEVAFGFGRTWRFAASAGMGGPQIEGTAAKTWWQGTRNVEYIEPIKAFAPAGDSRPTDMTGWTIGGNNHFRGGVYSGNPPAQGYEYYDAGVYTSGVGSYATLTSPAIFQPNWALHIGRQAVPGNQGCHTYVSVAMPCQTQNANGTWTDGMFGLILPIQDATYKEAFLHLVTPYTGGIIDTETTGVTVSKKSQSTSVDQDEGFDTITFEYVPNPDGVSGGWVLIRDNTSAAWWMYHNPRVRLVPGQLIVSVSGMQCWVNLSPITYGGAAGAAQYGYANSGWPVQVPLCNGSSWNTDPTLATWGTIESAVTGWTTDVGGYIVGQGSPSSNVFALVAWEYMQALYAQQGISQQQWYYAHLGFTRTSDAACYTRPVTFAVNELHTTYLGDNVSTSSTTEGNKNLSSMSGTIRADWRGSDGEATFLPDSTELYPNWKENAPLDINVGWQGNQAGGATTYPIRKLAQGYIKPRGVVRKRDGEVSVGNPVLSVQWGDFSMTRMTGEIADAPQAGGVTVYTWFCWVANLLAVPLSKVYIDPTIANLVIPTAVIPSDPKFEANGKRFVEHCNEVCKALNIRWGCDRQIGSTWYTLFVDHGRAAYIPGTSVASFTINDSNVADNLVKRLTHENQPRDFNAFRAETGPENQKQVSYWVDSLAVREAGIGQARWKTERKTDTEEAANIADGYAKYWSGFTNTITWDTFLHPDMLPELFVLVATEQFEGIAAGTWFQIDTHRWVANKETQESHFTGLIVFDPTGNYIPPYGSGAFGSGT